MNKWNIKNKQDVIIDTVLSSGIFKQELRHLIERRKARHFLCLRYNRRLLSERRGVKSVDTYV